MPYVLPHQHRLAHEFALHCHDIIAGLLRSAEERGDLQVRTQLSSDEQNELGGLRGEALYKWLEVNRAYEVTLEMDYKAILAAVVADFCHFVLEGLKAATRGKLTVAYALFRKPLKDNLFILEWLLADPADFLTRFHLGPDEIDVSRVSPERRKQIIELAIQRYNGPGLDEAIIYSSRYDKASNTSLAGAWDRAIHLVTTWKATATERQNLNFVFSGSVELQSQWANIYWSVPYLLHHASYVAHALFTSVMDSDPQYETVMTVRRAIGYELWAEYARGEAQKGQYHASLTRLIELLPIRCPNCSAKLRYSRLDLRRFFLRGQVRCSTCRNGWVWSPEPAT